MTDTTNQDGFQPSDVEATRGREQGLGMGERELSRQGDVGDLVAAPEEDRDFQAAGQDSEDAQDSDLLDENTSVLGTDPDLDEDDTAYAVDEDDELLEDDDDLDHEALEDISGDEVVEKDDL